MLTDLFRPPWSPALLHQEAALALIQHPGVVCEAPAMSCAGSCSVQGLSPLFLDTFRTKGVLPPSPGSPLRVGCSPSLPWWLLSVDLRLELGEK